MGRPRKSANPEGASWPVGDRLREERMRLSMNQTELGEASQTHRNTVMRYETGERKPDVRYLAVIEKLGVDVTYVLTGTRKSTQPIDVARVADHVSPEIIADKVLAIGDKRSAAYRRGLVDVLALRLNGTRIQCPYQPGTSEFDAYFAGNDRGHFQWRLMVEGAWKPN